MMVLEVLGGLVLFVFLSVFSFILLPSLFGCFGFILFLILFLALLIFFSVSIGWFIVVAIVAYLLLAAVRFFRYQRLPDYDSYLANSQNLYREGKIHCSNCGSAQLIHSGIFGQQSKLRYFQCLSCRKLLYKFKVL